MAYVLIIDDDEDFSDAVAIVLRSAGHEVAEELTIVGGRESVAARRPDVLILDVMFPGDSAAGLKLAQHLRRDFSDLPIILLTAVNQEFPLGLSKRDIDDVHMPITDFLEKPVDLDTLSRRVSDLAERTR